MGYKEADINTMFAMPHLLAEHLEPEYVLQEMEHYETRRNPEGLFRSAWNYVECGLNQSMDFSDERREYYFEYAQNLIGMVLHGEKTHQDTKLGALVLSTYVPLFQKRSLGVEITNNDCHDVYQSLGRAMSYLQPITIDEPPQWRMAETAVLALASRAGRPDLLLYPTSPREESSAIAPFNHDSYFLHNDDKIPIQQKVINSQKEYDDWVTILTLEPMIASSLRRSNGDAKNSLAEHLTYLIGCIIAEAHNQSMSRSEIDFLKRISAGVVAYRWKSKAAA